MKPIFRRENDWVFCPAHFLKQPRAALSKVPVQFAQQFGAVFVKIGSELFVFSLLGKIAHFCRRSVSILLFSHNVYVSFAQLGFETGNVVPVVFGGCVLKWISHPVRIVFAAGKDVVGQRVDALRFVAEAGKDI